MNLALRYQSVPDSPLARWDGRWKLAALAIAVGAIASLDHLAPAVVALVCGVFLLRVTRLPGRWVQARLAVFALAALPFLILLPFTIDGNGWGMGGFHFSERGLFAGLAVFCRCLAIGSLALVLVGTAPLHHTFAAAHRLKVPGLLVFVALLAHRYAFLLADELRRLRVALWARGFRPQATRHGYRALGHVAGAVLVRGADRADRVADAMRCRGFEGRFHSLAEFRTNGRDVVFCLLAVLIAAGLLVWDRLLFS
jgi:cobalt/nickel transport system permease protein